MADEKRIGEETGASRRAFIKTVVIGGAAVVTAAGVKSIVSSTGASGLALQGKYIDDDLQQEKIMKDKQYVLMTRQEKESMVEMFVNDYNKQA